MTTYRDDLAEFQKVCDGATEGAFDHWQIANKRSLRLLRFCQGLMDRLSSNLQVCNTEQLEKAIQKLWDESEQEAVGNSLKDSWEDHPTTVIVCRSCGKFVKWTFVNICLPCIKSIPSLRRQNKKLREALGNLAEYTEHDKQQCPKCDKGIWNAAIYQCIEEIEKYNGVSVHAALRIIELLGKLIRK